jgi:hypothetical protein
MADRYFISYSRADGEAFAFRIADALEAGPPSYRVWLDQRDEQPGGPDWDDQIVEAIRTCRALLFVMTADSVGAGSGCKYEWARALRYRKPVIPLLLDVDAEVPLRLEGREAVDFSRDFAAGLARLRQSISGFKATSTTRPRRPGASSASQTRSTCWAIFRGRRPPTGRRSRSTAGLAIAGARRPRSGISGTALPTPVTCVERSTSTRGRSSSRGRWATERARSTTSAISAIATPPWARR